MKPSKKNSGTAPAKFKVLTPKTRGQYKLCKAIEDPTKRIILVSGPAGTGKTSIASYYGIKGIADGTYNKIYVTRPAIEACGENFGFLKGGLDSKIYPYLIPVYEEFEKWSELATINRLKQEKKIEIAPLAFMRGRNLESAFVILDEAQNVTRDQFKMILTRLHDDSKIVICGDFDQSDRGNRQEFRDICERLDGMDVVQRVQLTADDIVRSQFIAEILDRLG